MYPALAVVQGLNQLCADNPPDILWVGSSGGMEQSLVERAGLKIELISAEGLRGKNPVAALRGVTALGKGYGQSRQIINRFQPDVLFVTGGYVCAPVTLVARRTGIPIVIYLPDVEPGLAIKSLARFAIKVAVTTEDSRRFFKPGLTVVTGYPVRQELAEASENVEGRKAEARKRLGLVDNLPMLLVFGGSRGARSINRAVGNDIEDYLAVCQVVHVSGTLDAEWVRSRKAEISSPELQARYHVFDYLHEDMTTALLAADLVISRAGASVMGEFPTIGLPSVLVPYPHAGTHQALNAHYLAGRHAAVAVDDADLNQDLKDTVINLITDTDKLQAMSNASHQLAKPDASLRLAQLILEVKPNGS